jgi:hypothetical protein
VTPAWSFEHARGWAPRKFARTTIRALAPARFFRSVRVETPLRTGRLRRSVLLWLALVYLAAVVNALAGEFGEQLLRGGGGPGRMTVMLAPGQPAPANATSVLRGPSGQVIAFVPIPPPPLADRLAVFGRRAWKAAIFPWHDGVVHQAARAVGLGRVSGERTAWFTAALLWPCCMPGMYLVLGVSLARVRVRPAHLWRGLAYGLTLPALAVIVVALVESVAHAVGPMWRAGWLTPWVRLVRTLPGVLHPLVAVWTLAFWYVFTKSYLRLPRAGLVVLLLWVASGLAAVAIVAYLAWLMDGHL